MPAPKIPRKPIPRFTKTELNRANLCAEALWYAVNSKTGDLYPISDANLMSRFAFNFYHFHKNKKKFQSDIFVADVRELILACGIKILFRGIVEMDLRKGINSLYKDVYPLFQKSLKRPSRVSSHQIAVKCLERVLLILLTPFSM